MASDKTEKATPKKREDERKKGHIFQSNDIVTAAGLLIMVMAFKLLGSYLYDLLQFVLKKYIGKYAGASDFSLSDTGRFLLEVILYLAVMSLPFLLIFVMVNILASGAQTKFIFKVKLKFDAAQLNPIKGFKKMFSLRAAVDILKSLLKLTIIGYMVYAGLLKTINKLPQLLQTDIPSAVQFIADSVYDLMVSICVLILVLAVIDYLYQWWEYERGMRMSKQEVKDETKQIEGDPMVKSAIRSRQRSIALSRMMQNLKKADVVIANPTHFAVALQYDAKKYKSPVVLAKGQDLNALRIREKAKELGIEIKENPPLARALYKAVDIGKEIPPEFYQAVAEILAVIYKSRKTKTGKS